MSELFRKLGRRCGQDVSGLLSVMAGAVERGAEVTVVWRESVSVLPIDESVRESLHRLDFGGDEEKLCKELSFAAYEMAKCVEVLESSRREDGKRTTALCFSGAALLVILLI